MIKHKLCKTICKIRKNVYVLFDLYSSPLLFNKEKDRERQFKYFFLEIYGQI